MNENKESIFIIIEGLEATIIKLSNDYKRISDLINNNMFSQEDIENQREKLKSIEKEMDAISSKIARLREILAISFKKTIDKMSEEEFNRFVEKQIAAIETETNQELVEFESRPENKKLKLLSELSQDMRTLEVQNGQIHDEPIKSFGETYSFIKKYGIEKFKAELLEAKEYYESKPNGFQFRREDPFIDIEKILDFLASCEDIIKEHSEEIEGMGLKDPDYYISKLLDNNMQLALSDNEFEIFVSLIKDIMSFSKLKEVCEKRDIKLNPEKRNIDSYRPYRWGQGNPLEEAQGILSDSIEDCPSYEEAVEYATKKEKIIANSETKKQAGRGKLEVLKTKDREKIVFFFIKKQGNIINYDFELQEKERGYKIVQETVPIAKKMEEKGQGSEERPLLLTIEKMVEARELDSKLEKLDEIKAQIESLISQLPQFYAMLKLQAEISRLIVERNVLENEKTEMDSKIDNFGEYGIFAFRKVKELNELEKNRDNKADELDEKNKELQKLYDKQKDSGKIIHDIKYGVDEARKALKELVEISRMVEGLADVFLEYKGDDYYTYLAGLLSTVEKVIQENKEKRKVLSEEIGNPSNEQMDSLIQETCLERNDPKYISSRRSILELDTKTAEELAKIFGEYSEGLSEEELEKVSSRGGI